MYCYQSNVRVNARAERSVTPVFHSSVPAGLRTAATASLVAMVSRCGRVLVGALTPSIVFFFFINKETTVTSRGNRAAHLNDNHGGRTRDNVQVGKHLGNTVRRERVTLPGV